MFTTQISNKKIKSNVNRANCRVISNTEEKNVGASHKSLLLILKIHNAAT